MNESPRLPAVLPAALAIVATVLLAACSGDGPTENGNGTPTPSPDAATATPTATAREGTPGIFADRILFGQSAAF